MTQVDLKKLNRYLLFILIGSSALFLLGSIRTLLQQHLLDIPLLFWSLLIVVIVVILFSIYLKFLENCQKKGKMVFGLRLIMTIHKYRFLIEQLVQRDFKIKYKRSVLGVFWSFLNPLLMMLVQYVVFSHLLNIRGDIQHYAIYLLCGIVIWNGFNDCSQQAMRSIIGNAPLITKVYVPKYIYPVTKVFSAFVNVLLSMIPLLLVTLIYGLFANPHLFLTETICLIPFGLLFLLVFCVGMGFLLSSFMVFFHDVEFLWGVFSSIWMYGTPIIYSLSMFDKLSGWIVSIIKINPMYHYIEFFRTIILYGASPAWYEYLICIVWALGMFIVGLTVFKKTQDKFILYL